MRTEGAKGLVLVVSARANASASASATPCHAMPRHGKVRNESAAKEGFGGNVWFCQRPTCEGVSVAKCEID